MLLVFILLTACNGGQRLNTLDTKKSQNVMLYYAKKDYSQLRAVKKKLSYEGEEDLLKKVIAALKEAPDSGDLITALPKNLEMSIKKEGHYLKINFSRSYEDLDQQNRIFLLYTLVKTFTDIQGIDKVEFFSDNIPINQNNEAVGMIRQGDIASLNSISPTHQTMQEIIVYAAKDGSLVQDRRTVYVREGEPTAKYVIQELIKGPSTEGLSRTIPSETILKNNIIIENGICYISFNKEFLARQSSDIKLQELAIYSIVNSLTELKDINKVQFLIEGQKEEKSAGFIDLSTPIQRNELLIK